MHITAVSEVRGYEFLWSCYLALAYVLTMCTPRGTSGSEASLGNNRIGDDGVKELSNALKNAQFLVSLKYVPIRCQSRRPQPPHSSMLLLL